MTPANHALAPDAARDPLLHAALYIRVSTEDQQEEGFSIPEQLDACTTYARRYGFCINEAHIFRDEVTGRTLNRPGLDALREVVAARLVQAVIVYKMSRLGRKHVEQVILWQEFKSHGVQLLDTATPPGDDSPEREVLFNILSAFSDYEHALILDRMEKGRRGRAKAGYPRKQRIPLGYCYVEEPREDPEGKGLLKKASRGHYEIEPHEAALVLQIFTWYARQGWTLYRIVQELNRTGIPTPRMRRGYKCRARAMDLWTTSTVAYLLQTRLYLGTQYYGRLTTGESLNPAKRGKRRLTPEDTWVPVKVPALIDPELWQAARLRATRNLHDSPRHRKHTYLLGGGRITCGICGRHMAGTTARTKRYYRCNAQNTGMRSCTRNLDGAKAEIMVWEALASRFQDPKVAMTLLLGEDDQGTKARSFTLQRQRLDKEQRQALFKLERLEDAYYAGAETPQEYAEKKARFTTEHDAVAAQLHALGAQETQTHYTHTARASLQQVLEGLAVLLAEAQTPEKQLDFLRLVDARVVYREDGLLEVSVQPWDPPAPAVAITSNTPIRTAALPTGSSSVAASIPRWRWNRP